MALSLIVAWRLGPGVATILGIVVTWFLVAMSMIDFDHQLLPDSMTLPLMWIGLLAAMVPVFADLKSAVIGAALGYMILWSIYQLFKLITGKEGMGFGDFKLLAALGALLGWQSLPVIILLSSAVGAIVGLALIAISKRDKNIPIPFGPYLAAAGWLAMLWGDDLSNWYYNFLA
jgi:leader peptidase (prepilin peptidase)/N-methyltransferase